MFSIGYYPGCSLGGSAKEYDISLKAIAPKLELELKEIPDWVCCGATSAHAMDHANCTPARNAGHSPRPEKAPVR